MARMDPKPGRWAAIRRGLLVSLATTIALAILVEVGTSVALAWHDSGKLPGIAEATYCPFDPELGWVNRPSARITDLYGPGRTLTTNAQGFRGLEDTPPAIPPGRYRIVCLGDSFTLGYGVDDATTFPARI